MTKSVRIENADTSSYGVKIAVYDKFPDQSEPVLVQEFNLTHPTQMQQIGLTSNRYAVITETPAPKRE